MPAGTAEVLALQRAAGNQAVAAALQAGSPEGARRLDRKLHGGQVTGAVVGPEGKQYTITRITARAEGGTLYELAPRPPATGEPFAVFGDHDEYSLAPGTQQPPSPLAAWTRLGVAGREAAGGLAAQVPVEHFAAAAVSFRQDNPDKSFEDLATFLYNRAVTLLTMIGSMPPALRFGNSGALGLFLRKDWALVINRFGDDGALRDKTLRELTPAQLGDAADTIYHEARHSEQFFRIARMLFGKGASRYAVMGKTTLPPEVVEAAQRRPLSGDDAAAAPLIAEAEEWHDITIGRHKGYMEGVKALAKPAGAMLQAAVELIEAEDDDERLTGFGAFHMEYLAMEEDVNKVEEALAEDDVPPSVSIPGLALVTHFDNLRQRVERLVAGLGSGRIRRLTEDEVQIWVAHAQHIRDARLVAYKAFAHEADAYSVGGAVSSAVVRGSTARAAASQTPGVPALTQ